ncbi:molybdopterin-guanine dinucleotide biosynthesis protein B [Azospirillum halopraeferens]|uniref:molybdopterin-guanine dinucleotide biosynthesis protein B n=1 Tax=Azospirillum halopraeferens TaxID=34010 RepID=UPI000420364F|nr:molybdopterin-guanine dinucleotide biosynthesis protein B [Azospirillum halopraeferens]
MRVIGLAGWSGSGKTRLLRRLVPALISQGLRVSTLKRAHHEFDVDQPGKDSWVHRQAGASEVLVVSAFRVALMQELRGADEPSLPSLLARMSEVDIVLVEGFKREGHPKIEVYRSTLAQPPIHLGNPTIKAIASDVPLPAAPLPVVSADDIDAIAALVLTHAVPPADVAWGLLPAPSCPMNGIDNRRRAAE